MQLVDKKGKTAAQLLTSPPEPSGRSEFWTGIFGEGMEVNPVDCDADDIGKGLPLLASHLTVMVQDVPEA